MKKSTKKKKKEGKSLKIKGDFSDVLKVAVGGNPESLKKNKKSETKN